MPDMPHLASRHRLCATDARLLPNGLHQGEGLTRLTLWSVEVSVPMALIAVVLATRNLHHLCTFQAQLPGHEANVFENYLPQKLPVS